MPKTLQPTKKTAASSSVVSASSSTIKELEAFIKAYNKQKEAQAELDNAKTIALEYLQNHISKYDRLKYKTYEFSLCERKTYNYSQLAIEMGEAYDKQKKLEQISGEATIKTATDYIRLNKIK